MNRQTSYTKFEGGVNTDVPALSADAGELMNAANYEAAISGGYRRMDGFEVFDGQTAPSSLIESDYADRDTWIAAIESARSDIDPVPGEGDILGVWRYNDVTYAFRNKTGGASTGMYKSTTSGWSEITTGVTLAPDGDYEFITTNFGGHSSSKKMYGVDGKNKGFQFDGTTFTQISTGMTTDTPTHLIAYKNALYYMFSGGSVQNSSIGDPTTWSAITGASEIGIGDEGTGFCDTPGNSLAVFSRNATHIISGTPGTSDLTMVSYSLESGAIAKTIQRVNYPICMNDNGLIGLQTTAAYGDFEMASLSRKINKLIRQKRGTETTSIIIKKKNQYRIFYGSTGISFTFSGDRISGAIPFNYGKTVTCSGGDIDSDGEERLFFGDDEGYVYEMDSGTSFDGEAVSAWLRPSFHHFRSPERLKRFFKIVLEIDAEESVDLSFTPVFDYGDVEQPNALTGTMEVVGGGGVYDEDNWDNFSYDGALVSSAYGYFDAIGKNFSVFIKSEDTYEKPHTIQGAIIHYSLKGLSR